MASFLPPGYQCNFITFQLSLPPFSYSFIPMLLFFSPINNGAKFKTRRALIFHHLPQDGIWTLLHMCGWFLSALIWIREWLIMMAACMSTSLKRQGAKNTNKKTERWKEAALEAMGLLWHQVQHIRNALWPSKGYALVNSMIKVVTLFWSLSFSSQGKICK